MSLGLARRVLLTSLSFHISIGQYNSNIHYTIGAPVSLREAAGSNSPNEGHEVQFFFSETCIENPPVICLHLSVKGQNDYAFNWS